MVSVMGRTHDPFLGGLRLLEVVHPGPEEPHRSLPALELRAELSGGRPYHLLVVTTAPGTSAG